MQRLVDVHMRLQRQCGIEYLFDPFLPMLLERGLDRMRARRCLLKDMSAGHGHEMSEQMIVLGKICMPDHMRNHQYVLGQ